jgi:small subunit ribosomal protein S9
MSEQTPAPAESPVEVPQVAPGPVALPTGAWMNGTGRRKTSVARVRVRPGEGAYTINGREIDKFFSEPRDRGDAVAPLDVTGTKGKMDVSVTVTGGGPTGQAGAIRLGLSRALKRYDQSLEAALREASFLTTDARQVERKKYGQPGARRRFQFSKR